MWEDKLFFDFSRAFYAEKADLKTYNGIKLVDFIIETSSYYLFIEVKDVNDPNCTEEDKKKFLENVSDYSLCHDLGQKFKDTLLLNWAKSRDFNKPIFYIVILEADFIDAALRLTAKSRTEGYLPLGLQRQPDIHRFIIEKFQILTLDQWNRKFPNFRARRAAN